MKEAACMMENYYIGELILLCVENLIFFQRKNPIQRKIDLKAFCKICRTMVNLFILNFLCGV